MSAHESLHSSPAESVVEEGSEEGMEEAAEAAEGEQPATATGEQQVSQYGLYNSTEVNEEVFEELQLGEAMAHEVQNVWNGFMKSAESREAAGEAIYAALFDSAPSLQSLFKTPRAVMAMRFMNGLNQIIGQLHDPKALKIIVETLGFQHLDLEVTVPRVVIFRDAIVDLLQLEMGPAFTSRARMGWCTMLNYTGGSYIYVRLKFTDRLRILASSWATANNKRVEVAEGAGEEAGEAKTGETGEQGGQQQAADLQQRGQKEASEKKSRGKWGWGGGSGGKKGGHGSEEGEGGNGTREEGENFRNTSVPTTYNEMFMFNAAVMGFGQNAWMNEVLYSFDTIVVNVSNSYRLQEECDVLSLRLAKYKGNITLGEYKAVMLASLRSLVPKDWNSAHEVAWSWLWENVERMIQALIGRPARQEKALAKLWGSLDENSQAVVRREVYAKFFTLAPAGQDFFKQSTTRLHFIADRIVAMTLEIYKDPKKMVEDISALGLRHVGYGIPTDLFGPFVTACVQVVRSLTDDDLAEEAFRWSLSLISRILTRVINEGSTIVMKAINLNSGKQLRKAVGCAPRGKRALWMLNIQVGTQSISPLLWAIETGSLDAAKAIIVDLLTIRADRDRYYYGMDTMFERHPDIVRRLCLDAPALLPTLFDGLIWRSRTTENGLRRVNYYVKHLMVDASGGFSQALEWIIENGDPKLVCHPVIAMVTDIVWSRIAFRTFLYGKSWLLLTLLVFIVGTAGLKHLSSGDNTEPERIAIFCCRCFIYVFSMGQWIFFHMKHTCKDVRAREFVQVFHIPVPAYLSNWQDSTSLLLTICLVMMLALEPILRCLYNQDERFTEMCDEADAIRFPYSNFAMVAMLLYFMLTVDLSVFSTRVSAWVLICFRVLSEVGLFIFGLFFFVATFSCAVSALDHNDPAFSGIHKASLSMLKITLGMYSGEDYHVMEQDAALLCAVFFYVVTTVVFLLNLLIAQLNCAYQSTYQDMVGFARLNRGKIVTDAMPSVPSWRWEKFVGSLRLDERCEFGEGDIGLSGGIQVLEPASANITTVDMIRRFGGSTSTQAQWPEEDQAGDDEEDRFERMEKIIEKAMKRMSTSRRDKKKGGQVGSSGQGSSDPGNNASGGSVHDSEHDSS